MHRHFELHHSEPQTNTTVLRVVGDLDLATAPAFKQVVGDLMGAGVRHVEVDLRETDFVDSSGLGALLWLDHRLHAVGGDMAVNNPVDNVARTFTLAGLGQLIGR